MNECHKAFTQLGNLKSHQIKYHGIEKPKDSEEGTHYEIVPGNTGPRVSLTGDALAPSPRRPRTPKPESKDAGSGKKKKKSANPIGRPKKKTKVEQSA
jgi:hypothetical protein